MDNYREFCCRLADELADIVDSAIHTLAFGPEHPPLDEIPSVIKTDQDVLSIVMLMIQGAGVSIRSLRLLISHNEMSVRDCFSISRSVCEICVNAAYLISKGPPAGQEAVHHAMARLYREGSRKLSLAGLKITFKRKANIVVEEFPELSEALARFTKNNGTEVSSWTKSNIDERINFVHSYSAPGGQSLAVSRFIIYRHSSEILHGSFYGVSYFWSATGVKPTSAEHAKRVMQGHVLQCMLAALLASHGLLAVLHKRHGLPDESKATRDMIIRFQSIILDNISTDPEMSP